MSDNQRYWKIGSIVDQFVAENQLPDSYHKLGLAFALWGFREFSLDSHQDVKTCLLDITDRRTVIVPIGFVDWVKIGLKYGQYCVTLGVNDDLNTLERTANEGHVNPLAFQMPNGISVDAYQGYYFFNYDGASLSGIGGGLPSKGFFKVVKRDTCTEILLDYDIPCTQLYLEYITDGFDPCVESVVNPYIANYVKKCIEFGYEEKHNPARTEASIFRKGRELEAARRTANGRMNQLDPKTMINISRKHTKLTPKI